MTAWKNELLTKLLEDPFENFSEIYDQGLFQFSANEIDLKFELSQFDQIQYDDTIRLEKNGVIISGYVKTRKRYPLELYGVIGLQNDMIIARRNVRRIQWAESTTARWMTPAEILRTINAGIFGQLNTNFGSWPQLAVPTYSYNNYSVPGFLAVSSEIYAYDQYKNEEPRFWKIKVSIQKIVGGYWTKTWLYDRKAHWLTDNWDAYSGSVREDSTLWKKIDDPQPPKSEIIGKWIEQKTALSQFYSNLFSKIYWDVENSACILIRASSFLLDYQLQMIHVKDYHGINFTELYFNIDEQPIANILSDLCFLFGSFFTVKEFNLLYVSSLTTGINTIDIANYHHYVLDYTQEVKSAAYQDYQLKTVGIDGGNAFGIGEDLVAALNNYYRKNYTAVLETKLKIYRCKNEFGKTDLPMIQVNDRLVDGNYDFGRVMTIDYLEEGRVYGLTCHRYLSSNIFNQWWTI